MTAEKYCWNADAKWCRAATHCDVLPA